MDIDPILKNTRFRTGIEEHSALKPLPTAAFISIAYVLLIFGYIIISGKVVEDLSCSIHNLAQLEMTKGIIFTFVTGTLFFIISFFALKKIAEQDDLIILQNKNIISTERLVTVGTFASSICHDINNMAGVIQGNLDLLKLSVTLTDEDKTYLEQIYTANNRLAILVKRTMKEAHGHIQGHKQVTNVSETVSETIAFSTIHFKLKTCRIESEIQPDILLEINAVLVARTLMNLLLNAADATDGTGKILVRLIKEDGIVYMETHDNGPGIPEDMIKTIFEPFYTSKTDGNGLGLLSLKLCAQQHNAKINIGKSHLGGAVFQLCFPADEKRHQVDVI